MLLPTPSPAALALAVLLQAGWCADPVDPWRTSVTGRFDNDFFAGNDDYYTNGIGLGITFDRPSGSGADPLGFLPGIGSTVGLRRYSLMLVQRFFTPDDIDSSDLVEDDMPYSGQLVLNASVVAADCDRLHAWTLAVGLVGPSSQASDIQTWYHDLFDQTDPAGWDHQLDDELVVDLLVENRFRICRWSGGPFAGDLITTGNGALGNLASYVDVGLGLRWGLHLPENHFVPSPLYGDTSIGIWPSTREDRIALYLVLYGNVSVIANNIVWDGNSDGDSHSVDHDHWAARGDVHLVLSSRRWHLDAGITLATIPWDQPDGRDFDAWGSLGIAATY